MTPYLQAWPTRLLGREGDLEAIGDMLVLEEVRLLTLTGPAGVGKTSLSIEAGNRISGEVASDVAFVDLSPVQDPSQVLQALAQGVGLQDVQSPRLEERLLAYLRERRFLIILDNFEHVLPAAGWLSDLLANCPQVKLLVTSREALRLRWEQIYQVSPLALPDPGPLPSVEELARVPSVSLFVERSRALNPGFALGEAARAVAELCIRLDGLPLAIELAAARTDVLSPRMILDRLGERLSLLRWEAPDLPERQRTLRSAIDWSYELLETVEQELFRGLGVFAGGFTLEAAQTVARLGNEETGHQPVLEEVLDGVASLTAKSLIQADGQDGEVRYRLVESVREYALEQLESREEVESSCRSHALYFLYLAERAEPELLQGEQRAWFLRLEAERDNFRAALQWLSYQEEDVLALRLATALGYFWWMRGYFAEGRRYLQDLLERTLAEATDSHDPHTRARALQSLGLPLLLQGEVERAREVLEESLAVARSTGEVRDSAISLVCLGRYETLVGKPDRGISYSEEALAHSREATDEWSTARALHELGVAALHAGDYGRSGQLLEEASAGFRRLGDERNMAEALVWLGPAVRERGDAPNAAVVVRQALDTAQALQDRRLLNMGMDIVLWMVGEEAPPTRLARLLGASEALRQITGVAHSTWEHTAMAPTIGALSDRLDAESLAEARREGHAMSLEQTARMTLAELDEWSGGSVRRGGSEEDTERGVLSVRESEVLGLVSEGLSNEEISQKLFIAERTVRFHLSSIFTKLEANNRTQAITFAKERDLL
jgi:non-specific serine/threonine protein kinase